MVYACTDLLTIINKTMKKIEDFVKEHELKTLSSQEGELLLEGMTGGNEGKNVLSNCSTNNCQSGNCVAGCGTLNAGTGCGTLNANTNCLKGCDFNGGGPVKDPINVKC